MTAERAPIFDIYQDMAGEWRWRLVAINGQIVADSAEGYANKANTKRAAARMVAIVSSAVTP